VTGRWLPAALALALLGMAGCGVPTSGEPETIPASEVPYGLASPTPTAPSGSSVQTMLAETGIYLVTAEDVLVARGRELPPGSVEERLEALLGQLAAGPSDQDLADELSTALPPEVELHVTDVADGTAVIDIAGPVDAPSGADSRLAVAQIVLTATSVPDVQAVRLTREGDPVDAPLPDGELTSEPLTADQFAPVLTAPAPSPTPTSRATPTPTPTPSPPS
jgi:Sporulation and spore germination